MPVFVTINTKFYEGTLSLRFNGHFSDGSGLAGTRTCPFWILSELRMTVLVITTCKAASRHGNKTNTRFFYRPDAPPVAQPTVSEH